MIEVSFFFYLVKLYTYACIEISEPKKLFFAKPSVRGSSRIYENSDDTSGPWFRQIGSELQRPHRTNIRTVFTVPKLKDTPSFDSGWKSCLKMTRHRKKTFAKFC